MSEFLTSGLYFLLTTVGPCLMYADTITPAMLRVYVDDIILAGCQDMVMKSDSITKRFTAKDSQSVPFSFAGSQAERTGDVFRHHQADNATMLTPLSTVSSFECFRRLRHQLAWLANTRLDILAAVNILSQVHASSFSTIDVRVGNAIQKRAVRYRNISPNYKPLGLETVHLFVYSDALFASNRDGSS